MSQSTNPPIYVNRPSCSEESSQFGRPDRVTFIIQNWNLQFDGSNCGLSVDEFLYRLRTLTKEHLNGNFSHICKNIPILLTGKAKDWFWRYHKTVDSIQWTEFCGALRTQFKDLRSDFDLMESIRSRKIKSGKSFDSFYESIEEESMVEILVRDLRPDIRHELLFVAILSIAHLRKLVQMRENLMNDDSFRKQLPQKSQFSIGSQNPRRNVAELQYEDRDSDEVSNNICVDAVRKDTSHVK